ncbi:MAG: MFS transporter [Anaerolineales bacterium]|nr:MFS transporter [Anaerolineales bacterium]
MIMQRIQAIRTTVEPWQKTLYIVFFAQLVSVVGFATIFPFLPLYVTSLGTNTSFSLEFLGGMVYSAQAFTMMLTAPLWGAVADRYGRKAMIIRSMFGGAVVVVLMGLATSAEMLVGLRALQGILTGTVSAANALVAASVPRKKLGYAMGLMQVALYGGVAVGPMLGGALADAFGYRMSFVLTAVLLFLAGILVVAYVHEDFTPSPSAKNGGKLSFLQDWKHIFAAPGVSIAYTVRFMVGLGQMIVYPVLSLYILSLLPKGSDVNTYTGLVIGIGGAASTATAIYFGKLGDRIGHRNILLVSSLLAAVFYMPQAYVTAAWQLLLLQALTGAAYGATVTSLTALLGQYTVPGEEGSVYGLDNAILAGSRSIAPLIGTGIAAWYSMRASFLVTGGLFVLIGLLVLVKIPKKPAMLAAAD